MGKTEKRSESWQERRKKIKHKWATPLMFIEWNCERLSDLLRRWAFLEILEHLGRLTIVMAVVFYFAESGSRRKAKHYQAWQVINSAQRKPGSGGRMNALQDLCADGISLRGVDISKAHLPEVNLENAVLIRANLSEAHLAHVNLENAVLSQANLSEAYLAHANLENAGLSEANLENAVLSQANLSEAYLPGANLAGAYLINIRNWRKIRKIERANIYAVKQPPSGFIEWAKEHGAVTIEDDDEWQKVIREKTQEAAKRREAQKKVP